LFPTASQRRTLKQWCGAARWFYNQALEKQVVNRKSAQVEMLAACPEWAKSTPYKIKQMAIEDEAIARRNGFKFAKQTGQAFRLAFRSKKMRRDSLYIPKQSVGQNGVYPRLLGSMKSAEPLERPAYDCRLLHENGKFYLLVPYNKPKCENQAEGEIAVDPGVRTFLTFFSPDVVGKLGDLAINRVQRLCAWMDKLISRKKWRAVRRMRERIRNLIAELHHKTALWLVKNFRVIVIPKFDAREMTVRTARKITSKTARKMLTLAHGRFRTILLDKAEEWGAHHCSCF
jgi:putative transposase